MSRCGGVPKGSACGAAPAAHSGKHAIARRDRGGTALGFGWSACALNAREQTHGPFRKGASQINHRGRPMPPFSKFPFSKSPLQQNTTGAWSHSHTPAVPKEPRMPVSPSHTPLTPPRSSVSEMAREGVSLVEVGARGGEGRTRPNAACAALRCAALGCVRCTTHDSLDGRAAVACASVASAS